uniref:Uncharacterized protein n=1 Tax=Xiphophorus couchianus TaxID=32473 RepID=A0A3B5KTD8_9TELE
MSHLSSQLLLQKLDFCVQKFLCREKDKDVVAMIRKTVLELDKLDLSEPFHKRHEWDLLDQKKEKEEMLLLEMEQLERQQSDGKLNSDKHEERKRELNLHLFPESPAVSNSTRKAKLSRSRSLSKPFTKVTVKINSNNWGTKWGSLFKIIFSPHSLI